jgi:hypothetical protein
MLLVMSCLNISYINTTDIGVHHCSYDATICSYLCVLFSLWSGLFYFYSHLVSSCDVLYCLFLRFLVWFCLFYGFIHFSCFKAWLRCVGLQLVDISRLYISTLVLALVSLPSQTLEWPQYCYS